jgi:hypothetical protein
MTTISRSSIAMVLLAVLVAAGGAAHAASLQDDRLRICDRKLEIAETLRPTALMAVAGPHLASGQFARIYPLFAERFEASLPDAARTRPEVAAFIAQLRAPSFEPRLFDVVPADDKTRETVFEGSTQEFALDCSTLAPYQANLAAVSLMTGWVRGQQRLPDIAARARFVAEQSRAHEALLNNGLPMWPWETWANGLRLGKSDWEPLFRTQWVLMRPTVGVAMGTRSRAEANLDASVGIEPLGFVHYRDADYRSWWGASLLVTSTTRDGLGLGALLRWNDYVLGVTRHQSDVPGQGNANFVFIGLDLYRMVNSRRDEFTAWKEQQRERVEELLNKR